MKLLVIALGLGVGWSAFSGPSRGGSMATLAVLFWFAMICSYAAGRWSHGRVSATATAVAVAEAKAESNAAAVAQGGQVVVNLNTYTPTAADSALGWQQAPRVPMTPELTTGQILELAPDDDYADVLSTYYGEGEEALVARLEGDRDPA